MGAGASTSFQDACRQVIGHLKEQVPFACWSVSRFDGERQVHEVCSDDEYGLVPGFAMPWDTTFCRLMVSGATPQLAPDAMAVPQYAAIATAVGMRVGAYAGIPIRDGDGMLFGTLCGFDPLARSDDLLRHAPQLHALAGLLGALAQVVLERDDAAEEAEELRWTARLDPLTGLTGRAAFLDGLAAAAVRDPAGAARALVTVAFDGSADLGDVARDGMRLDVAGRLSGVLHPFDLVGRLGDDEFAVLVHDAADLDPTVARIRDALRGVGGRSAGIGTVRLDGAGPDALLARARAAGRGPVDAPDVAALDVAALDVAALDVAALDVTALDVAALREAIRSGAIRPVYQPIVRLADGAVVAYEALARWTHDGVAVPPDTFVPLAARSGLLPDLTDHMIEQAAAQLAGWSRTLGHRRTQVGVNVPPALLLDPGFPDRVAGALGRHGLGPDQLVLEITEDALLDDVPAARTVGDRLVALGVVLCLDDVGSGYSSLRHLRRLPLRAAKIDREFVDDIDTDEESRHFLATVLRAARDLGLNVVVEGVERAGQLDVLRSLGAVLVQGHHLGGPADPGDIDVRAP